MTHSHHNRPAGLPVRSPLASGANPASDSGVIPSRALQPRPGIGPKAGHHAPHTAASRAAEAIARCNTSPLMPSRVATPLRSAPKPSLNGLGGAVQAGHFRPHASRHNPRP